jgi:hypothetical protein
MRKSKVSILKKSKIQVDTNLIELSDHLSQSSEASLPSTIKTTTSSTSSATIDLKITELDSNERIISETTLKQVPIKNSNAPKTMYTNDTAEKRIRENKQTKALFKSRQNRIIIVLVILIFIFISSVLLSTMLALFLKKPITFDSSILSTTEQDNLRNLAGFKGASLCYRASRDGFHAYNFHQKCDNLPNVLTLIKSHKNNVFGGYSAKPWVSSSVITADTDAFLFSLRRENFTHPTGEKFPVNETECATFYYSEHYFAYGCGHDLYIYQRPDLIARSYSSFCWSYSCGDSLVRSSESKHYLAGSYHFYVLELEAFQVTF